jgi:hypothetical protein
LPERAKSKPDIQAPESQPKPAALEDSPESAPEVHAEVREAVIPRRASRPKMVSLTLLDGTTISIPAPPKKHPSRTEAERPASAGTPGQEFSDQLTARDLVSALRALAHGADASEILGAEPHWEALFSALLSILLRKGLIADWEFIEEFRKI